MKKTAEIALVIFIALSPWFSFQTAFSQTEFRVRDICRLKGQEQNVLQGLGLVVGLKGTGDGDMKQMTRALARSMQLMGGQVAVDLQGKLQEKDLATAKNVALVFVTTTIPPTGAQPGDLLPCTISAINAKSLEGGILMTTPLLGPRADQPTVYALAQGPVLLENPKLTTTGKIVAGCKMEAAVRTEFVSGDYITLVLDPNHSSFEMAQQIEDTINDFYRNGLEQQSQSGSDALGNPNSNYPQSAQSLAVALDQLHVTVRIPPAYRERPVQFIALVEDLPLVTRKKNRRVVVREREGVLVIGEDVTIAPVAISHKNLTISTRAAPAGGSNFVGVSYDKSNMNADRSTLKQLVDALNLLAVPTDDIIAIIKAIDRQGNLYGELVIE